MEQNHWHAMTSFAGCLPETNETYATREDAVEAIVDMYPEYSDRLRRHLTRYGHSDVKRLHAGHSTLYAEVYSCGDPACESTDADQYF